MRLIRDAVLVAAILGGFSTQAFAVVTLVGSTGLSLDPGPAAGQVMVWNFDGIADPRFSYSGNVYSASIPGTAAEPAGDTSHYGAAEPASAGQPFTNATLTLAPGYELTSLSFDLGSLDSYNSLTFYSGNGEAPVTFTGSQLTATPDGNQMSDLTNRRYYFTFGAADDIDQIVFSSTYPAFEFDNFAAAVSAVPEPATWAMMIFGFGFVGFMARNARQKNAAAVA
jgi:hypothetical protein